jgi:hypothetical protein
MKAIPAQNTTIMAPNIEITGEDENVSLGINSSYLPWNGALRTRRNLWKARE